MSARSRAEGVFLVLAILTLFGLLILLISSLDELSFQPGKLLPRMEAVEEDEVVIHRTIPDRSDTRCAVSSTASKQAPIRGFASDPGSPLPSLFATRAGQLQSG